MTHSTTPTGRRDGQDDQRGQTRCDSQSFVTDVDAVGITGGNVGQLSREVSHHLPSDDGEAGSLGKDGQANGQKMVLPGKRSEGVLHD